MGRRWVAEGGGAMGIVDLHFSLGSSTPVKMNPNYQNPERRTRGGIWGSPRIPPALLELGAVELTAEIKKWGLAGGISYGAFELLFWGVSVPIACLAFIAGNGHVPDMSNVEDAGKVSAWSLGFITLARFAVPFRIDSVEAFCPGSISSVAASRVFVEFADGKWQVARERLFAIAE